MTKYFYVLSFYYLFFKRFQANKYPWLARIWERTIDADNVGFCGGSLVAPQFVLTAAHCTETIVTKTFTVNGKVVHRTDIKKYNADEIKVSLGTHNIKISKSALLFINVQTIRKHPQFQGLAYTHLGYDIAVLKLERQVWAFTPVCLAKSSEVEFLNFGTWIKLTLIRFDCPTCPINMNDSINQNWGTLL